MCTPRVNVNHELYSAAFLQSYTLCSPSQLPQAVHVTVSLAARRSLSVWCVLPQALGTGPLLSSNTIILPWTLSAVITRHIVTRHVFIILVTFLR